MMTMVGLWRACPARSARKIKGKTLHIQGAHWLNVGSGLMLDCFVLKRTIFEWNVFVVEILNTI